MNHISIEMDHLRSVIDAIDDRIVELVERRLEAARAIAAAKDRAGQTRLKFCPVREREVLARLQSRTSPANRPAIRDVWRELMAHSLQAQASTSIVMEADDPALKLAVRNDFGSAAPVIAVGCRAEALRLAGEGDAIAILRLPLPPLPAHVRAIRAVRDEGGRDVAIAVGRVADDDCSPQGQEGPETWHPASWRARKASQMPIYASAAEVSEVERQLGEAAPVIAVSEAAALKAALARVAAGEAFLLQGGDCAESFDAFAPEQISANHALLLAAGQLLPAGVVHVARAAGQFAKPRSSNVEAGRNGPVPSYRGDAVNGFDNSPASRQPDPRRLLRAHAQSRATAKLLEGLSASAAVRGEADPVYASHEALLLNYEQALTRWDPENESWWATSGHMIWIGERTRDLEGAHVEYARGVANPVGLKCGPHLTPEELLRLIECLDPHDEAGRLTLIGRFGAEAIGSSLPRLMAATRSAGRSVIWACDPMHGNNRVVNGTKTRLVDDIASEVRRFFQIAASEGVHAGGLHLEMTAGDVTECIGGRVGVTAEDLGRRYESLCDPRLNLSQTLEIVSLAAACLDRLPVVTERAA